MGYGLLIQVLAGMTKEEITANWHPPSKPEDFDTILASKRARLATISVQNIIARAQAGEIDAVEWLEKHGVLAFHHGHADGPPPKIQIVFEKGEEQDEP